MITVCEKLFFSRNNNVFYFFLVLLGRQSYKMLGLSGWYASARFQDLAHSTATVQYSRSKMHCNVGKLNIQRSNLQNRSLECQIEPVEAITIQSFLSPHCHSTMIAIKATDSLSNLLHLTVLLLTKNAALQCHVQKLEIGLGN